MGDMRCWRSGCVLAGLLVLLPLPAGASAAQRWTTPESTARSGACTAASPCRIDYAIEGAADGDEVVVAPGTYQLTQTIDTPGPIELHGVAGQPRPRLISSAGTTALNFKDGGSVRHLAIEATGSGQDALTLRGGVGEDLMLRSATGDGGKVNGDPGGTILRDSVVQTGATDSTFAGLKLRDSGSPGDATLVNVTVMAVAGSAIGIRCELSGGQARLINTIVRGAEADVDASTSGANCTARSSNLRLLLSPGLVAGPGNQGAAPRFIDAANSDFRPLADSPTVDAGSSDTLLGASDPAGCSRALGLAPDVGAYEYADPATPCAWTPHEPVLADPASPSTGDAELDQAIRGVPLPVLGETVVVSPGSGKVFIRRPASPRFRVLDEPARVPVGSVLDASAGQVQLVSNVSADGRLQAGTFWGARFQVRQSRRARGMTVLVLRGGDFSKCRRPGSAHAHAVAVASRHRRVRSLWARDSGGRFRTYGRNSHATVRGTRWLTADRCDGTLTKVTSGAVAVRDRARRKTVLVRAGRSYLARKRR